MGKRRYHAIGEQTKQRKRVKKTMKQYKSKIGEYGVRWKPVEGYKRKDGVYIQPHMKKEVFKWKNNNAS
jgi:hypothetical protein